MNRKVLLLLSGGLDSTLSLKLLQEQNCEVEAVNFKTIFCRCSKNGCISEAKKVTDKAGVKLHVYNITNDFLPIVLKPPHGYGSNMNPCIDCRILMYKKAKEIMDKIGADFIATGEVIGQRPMSQNINAINIIEKESLLKGKVLRPLSEIGIHGRSRKKQIELAGEKGVSDYPCPAGGCLLTEPAFAKRLRDLINNNGTGICIADVLLLKIGRHFRISSNFKLVVGRNEDENKRLKNLVSDEDILLEVEEYVGPVGLIRTSKSGTQQGWVVSHFEGAVPILETELKTSASIVARYSDAPKDNNIKVNIRKYSTNDTYNINVNSIDEKLLKNFIV